jgi:hypothetical protein
VDARDAERNYVGPDEIKNALIFARATADAEVESIERIHKRTLVSFGYVGGAVFALAAIFGYIGYSNIQAAAITTAKAQMQKEVEEQVREKLTTEHIDQIVRDQLRDLSATSLHEQIHKELISDPLASTIRQVAEAETKAQVAKQFSPRHLSPKEASLLIETLASSKGLNGYPVSAIGTPYDFEAMTYAAELRNCLSKTMKVQLTATYDQPVVEGLGIYYDRRQPEPARLLQDALRAAGLNAKLVPGTYAGGQLANMVFQDALIPAGQNYPLEIYVGSKTLR